MKQRAEFIKKLSPNPRSFGKYEYLGKCDDLGLIVLGLSHSTAGRSSEESADPESKFTSFFEKIFEMSTCHKCSRCTIRAVSNGTED